MDLIAFIILSFLPFAVTWITTPQELFIADDKNTISKRQIFQKTTFRKITRKGIAFIIIAIVTICLAMFQNHQNNKATKALRDQLAERDSLNQRNLAIRDSINQVELDRRDNKSKSELLNRDSINDVEISRRDSLANVRIENGKNQTISELAKYGLKYDSAQIRVEKLIKDSAKSIETMLPDLNLSNDTGLIINKISDFEYEVKVKLSNRQSQSKKINIKAYLVSLNKFDEYVFRGELPVLPKNAELSVDALVTFDKYKLVSSVPLKICFLLLIGEYSDSRNKNIIKTNTLVFYDLETKNYGIPGQFYIEKLRSFLNKNGINN